MATKDILKELREKKKFSRKDVAEKIGITARTVSNWERGVSKPNKKNLTLLSKCFDVSINTLLGSPKKLICQCCGMLLDDKSTSKEKDGTFNEKYCKWCYVDGKFVYTSLEEISDFLSEHMSNDNFSVDQAKEYFKRTLKNLEMWKDK
ncbi:MAG: helix-turn-helix domain-containing protein [Firmicutes bacterium]|nr:helix-turn-helix domain-containing protein [Bacillota bacterium]